MSGLQAGLGRFRNEYRSRFCKSSLHNPLVQGIVPNIKEIHMNFFEDQTQDNISLISPRPVDSSTPMSSNSRKAAQSKKELPPSTVLDNFVKNLSKGSVSKSLQTAQTNSSPRHTSNIHHKEDSIPDSARCRDKTVKKRILGIEIGRPITFSDDDEEDVVAKGFPVAFGKEAEKQNVRSEMEKVAKPTATLYTGDTSAVLEPTSPTVKLQARKRLSFKDKEKKVLTNQTGAAEVNTQKLSKDQIKLITPIEKIPVPFELLNRTPMPSTLHTASEKVPQNGESLRNEETPISLRKPSADELEKLEKANTCTGVQTTFLENEKQSNRCNMLLKDKPKQSFKSIFLGTTQPENRSSTVLQPLPPPPPPAEPPLRKENYSDDEFIICDASSFTFKSWTASFKNTKLSAKQQTTAAGTVTKTSLEKPAKPDVTQNKNVTYSSQTVVNNDKHDTPTIVNIPQMSNQNKKVNVKKKQVRKTLAIAGETSEKLSTHIAVENCQEQNKKTGPVKDQAEPTLAQTCATAADINSTALVKAREQSPKKTFSVGEDLAMDVNKVAAMKKKIPSRKKKKDGKQKSSKTVVNKNTSLAVVAVEKGLSKVQTHPANAGESETRHSLAQTDTNKNETPDKTRSKHYVLERISSRIMDNITQESLTNANVKMLGGKMLRKSSIVNPVPEIDNHISSADDASRQVRHLVKSPSETHDEGKDRKNKKQTKVAKKLKQKSVSQDNATKGNLASGVNLAEDYPLPKSTTSRRQSAVHHRQTVVAVSDACSYTPDHPSVSENVCYSKKHKIDVTENNEVNVKPVKVRKSILKARTHTFERPEVDMEEENLQAFVTVPPKLESRVSALRKTLLPNVHQKRLSSFKGSLETFDAAYAKTPVTNKMQPQKPDLEVNEPRVSSIKHLERPDNSPGHIVKVNRPQKAILAVSSPSLVKSGATNEDGGQVGHMDYFTEFADGSEEELEPSKHEKKVKCSAQKKNLIKLSSTEHTINVNKSREVIPPSSSLCKVYSGPVSEDNSSMENMENASEGVGEVLEEAYKPNTHGKEVKSTKRKEHLSRLSSVEDASMNSASGTASSETDSPSKRNKSCETCETARENIQPSDFPSAHDGSSILKSGSGKVTSRIIKMTSDKDKIIPFQPPEPDSDSEYKDNNSWPQTQRVTKKQKKIDSESDSEIKDGNPSPQIQRVTKKQKKSDSSSEYIYYNSRPQTQRVTKKQKYIDFESNCENIDGNPSPQIKRVTKKKKKIVLPSHTPNVRRSKRTRVQPLEYWRGERVEYSSRPSGGFIVDGVLSPEDDNIFKKSKTKRKDPVQRETKDQKRFEDRNDATVTEPTLVLDPVEGKPVYLDCVKTEEECVFRYTHLIGVCKSLSQPMFSTGKLILGPLQEKGLQHVCQNTLIFYVVDGAVLTTLHCTDYRLKTGDYFFVPPSNMYNIKNLLDNRSSVMVFVQLKENQARLEDTR